jgi:hypothetical protein
LSFFTRLFGAAPLYRGEFVADAARKRHGYSYS